MMDMPVNRFKRRLDTGEVQYGIWAGLADPVAAEIVAGAGFDWMLIDAEHAPNDLRTVLAQIQAVAAYPVSPVVRPVRADAALIKQYLDLGAQSILAPMVESAAQAQDIARSMRYPPQGRRGVATARAARWGRVTDYWSGADDEACLIAQIESRAGLAALPAIAAVDGIDALFVGPSDLAADLGHLGDPGHAEVRAHVCGAIAAIRDAGKPAGVLATSPELAAQYTAAGAAFVAVGVDTMLLARSTAELAERFIRPGDQPRP